MLVVKNAAGVPSVATWIRVAGRPEAPTAPTAGFSATPTSGPAPLAVSFTSTSTGTGPLQYEWDFRNDGTVDSTQPNPSFTYANPGSYSVKLTVRNAAGADDELKVNHVVATEPSAPTPPTAGFSGAPTSGAAPMKVTFANTSTGTAPLAFEWDFQNDGIVDSTEPNPDFTYVTAGTYTVASVLR